MSSGSVSFDMRPESSIRRKRRRPRIKQIPKKLGSCIINNESVFKVTWDWFVLVLVLYTAIEIPFTMSFLTTARQTKDQLDVWKKINSGEPHEIINIIVDVMFIVDIVINFRTTYVEQKTQLIISEPKKIAIHYLKTWFFVDFGAAIPFDYFFNPGAASLAGLFKTARLLRLIRVSRKMDRYSEFGLAVIFLLTSLFTLFAHWLACLWHLIGEEERNVPYGWIQKLGNLVGKPVNQSVTGSGPDTRTRYLTSLYFTITSLTSIGFGNIAPNTDTEKIFSVLMMLIGAMFYAVIFGNLTAIIQRLYSRTARYHRDVRVVNEFIAMHDMPESLQGNLREYFTNEQAAIRGDDIESIMYRFPESLQSEIRLYLNHSLFDQFDIFEGVSEGCLRALASVFRIEVFPRQHYLIKEGDVVTKLFFIVSGSVNVMDGNQCGKCLGAGDVLGCSMLPRGCYSKACVSLVAKISCQVHLISWRDLAEVMKVYPEIKERILEEMELSCNLSSTKMGTKNSMKKDQDQDHVEMITMAVQNDQEWKAPQRRGMGSFVSGDTPRAHRSDGFGDQYTDQEELFTPDKQTLEQLESKLTRMEDLLLKILVSLQDKDNVTMRDKPSGASTSYV